MSRLLVLAICLFAQSMNAQSLNGKPAFPIKLSDPSGKVIQLDSYRGKWVLLDFWASWCGPCRASNRTVRNNYAAWKAKGLEVLGISLDEDRDDWIKAIKQDRITWPQVNTPAQWNSEVVLQWQIERIPTTYLIDPQGIIRETDPEPKLILSLISKKSL